MAGKSLHEVTAEEIIASVREHGRITAAADVLGIHRSTLDSMIGRLGLREQVTAARQEYAAGRRVPRALPADPEDEFREQVRKLISGKKPVTIDHLADHLDVSPKRVRAALEALREAGYRVPEEAQPDQVIALEPVLPDKLNLHRALLEGNEITVGVVSDTHLCSKEEALPHLNLAYDEFERRGIREVWHEGDIVAGVGVYRNQVVDLKVHDFEGQVEYGAEHFPRRDGIVTRVIGGNHDLEGDFGKLGANPVAGISNIRGDIENLGDFSAWMNIGPDEERPCWVHLLHGSGGMSYSYSYKAQKLVDGYSSGRKPAILITGHWHVAGWIVQRAVNVFWPGCFEWQTSYMKRKGLSPQVGFWILKLTVGDDGSLVGVEPKWHQFFEGRHVEATTLRAVAA